ncbi:hypothetical protein NEMBOFW57_006832 [Staphylotrichum longicolle]|uniref:Uncharacterized protein n=1 Tax=Staphylotrichum longicolle TaxID=669026 RepID=A0AAD4ETI3_9PEZI|nr:hypothetical protein NEMBOFW57_006832 [Staphylotrichum longicolle]
MSSQLSGIPLAHAPDGTASPSTPPHRRPPQDPSKTYSLRQKNTSNALILLKPYTTTSSSSSSSKIWLAK